MTNSIEVFLAKRISISDQISINLLFPKDMNLRELVECYIQIQINISEKQDFRETKKLRYVIQDKFIDFDRLVNFIKEMFKSIIKSIDALEFGIALNPDTIFSFNNLDTTQEIVIKRELKRNIQSLTEYKLQPFIIELFTALTSFKGTDTLQKRKYEKMIISIQDAMMYQQRGV